VLLEKFGKVQNTSIMLLNFS